MSRVYLDWNATAPLRPEAREAMLAAMDAAGNPSSVHAEGRAAKAIVEKARGQVAALVSCEPGEVVFTSGATEAAQIAVFRSKYYRCSVALTEHDAVEGASWHYNDSYRMPNWLDDDLESSILLKAGTHQSGPDADRWQRLAGSEEVLFCIQHANSETGVISDLDPDRIQRLALKSAGVLRDVTQSVGKVAPPYHLGSTLDLLPSAIPHFYICAAHKFGGPKGVGALALVNGAELARKVTGGGQEQGRRSGTENVIGIAGFGAAAEAAQRDLEAGVWERVERLRDQLEDRLATEVPDLIIFGHDAPRLPNTSCFAIPAWRGETQVIQMDLAGFAVSAGSACSSGKVGPSRVLLAMGFDEETAASAIRVSMGPTTTEAEVMGFADTWIEHYRRRKVRAA